MFALRLLTLLSITISWIALPVDVAQAQREATPTLPKGFQLRTFQDQQGEHRYTVFLPVQYDASRKWPVVLFLHGAGEKGSDGILPLSGFLATALESWPDAPFIAVFPQVEDQNSRALTGWLADGTDGKRAIEILAAVERDFSIDPSKRILIGWSMGGYGAWSQAAAHPDLWSAVLVLAGGALNDQLPLESLAKAKVPVWAISAKGDPLIPFERSQKLINELNKLGGAGHDTLLPSDDHDVCRTVFASKPVFEWLLDPQSVQPEQVSFENVTPLPSRSKFYTENIEEFRVIPNALGMRLGNSPLTELAAEIPSLLPTTALEGKIADIHRTFGNGADQIRVAFSDVSYRCDVPRVWMHGISGGRLGLEVYFKPLVLNIGKTHLDSRRHQARTGPIAIQIGFHEPAVLKIEVQPVMQEGRLRLRLLRKNFLFDDSNWYITPPIEVDAKSDQFTSDQLVTGILGGLYGGKQELTDQILGVVPGLISQVEDQLQAQSAPALARLLSPLPVLVPNLTVSPSQVRTDRQGVSVLCNLNIGVRKQAGQVNSKHSLQLSGIPDNDRLGAELALDAVTSVSKLNLDQNFGHVNVLDISEEEFARLADPHELKAVFPELEFSTGTKFSSVLRLLEPLRVTKAEGAESLHQTQLQLIADSACIDFYQQASGESTLQPVARVVFKLGQVMQISFPTDRASENASLQLRWAPDAKIEFLRTESLQGSKVPAVNADAFIKLFGDAWSAWGQKHGGQEIPMLVARIGNAELRIDTLTITDHELELQFETRQTPPPAVEEAGEDQDEEE